MDLFDPRGPSDPNIEHLIIVGEDKCWCPPHSKPRESLAVVVAQST